MHGGYIAFFALGVKADPVAHHGRGAVKAEFAASAAFVDLIGGYDIVKSTESFNNRSVHSATVSRRSGGHGYGYFGVLFYLGSGSNVLINDGSGIKIALCG